MYRSIRLAVLMLSFAATQAFGVTLFFGAPDFTWNHPGGGATPNFIWTAGDSWSQNFTGTGLASASALTLNIFYDDNNLLSGNPLDMSVLINATTVGAFVINPGDASGSYVFNFASILGPDYNIELLATNTINGGQGAVSMSDSGTDSNAVLSSSTPEPSTLCLIAGGLGALAALRRRRA
jgi:PEP-CTERM motif